VHLGLKGIYFWVELVLRLPKNICALPNSR